MEHARCVSDAILDPRAIQRRDDQVGNRFRLPSLSEQGRGEIEDREPCIGDDAEEEDGDAEGGPRLPRLQDTEVELLNEAHDVWTYPASPSTWCCTGQRKVGEGRLSGTL